MSPHSHNRPRHLSNRAQQNCKDKGPLHRQMLQRGYLQHYSTYKVTFSSTKYGGIAMISRFLAGAICATSLLVGTCANADPGIYPMSNFFAMFTADSGKS